MIGITKLLTGEALLSAAVRADGRRAPHLLQFSAADKPVVVWNMTDRCNLECSHCYLSSSPDADARALATGEARSLIDDLAQMGAPVLLFSGGEPLLREDLFELASYASAKGLRPSLSTNGTLITREAAVRLKDAGIAYVGVSIDGTERTHDAFRCRRGAFADALAGIAAAAAAGLRTGVRFTLNKHNAADLGAVLDMVAGEGIGRFCMYHLVYAGRGASMRGDDVALSESRAAVELLIEKALAWASRGIDAEILTTDNHADGALVLRYIERSIPGRAADARALLEMAGGCSAGRKFACIGSDGSAYPCQFWRHEPLGNVRESRLSALWQRGASALIDTLKDMGAHLSGRRCRLCRYKAICGGCRIRALAATGDAWSDDPQCYLSDAEIGIV